MAIGETLLKITDYPFTYSLVFLWLRFSEIEPFSSEAIPFLALAGFVGTVLAILDPIGRGVKLYMIFVEKAVFNYYSDPNVGKKLSFKILSKINPKLLITPKMKKEWEYIEGAFHTKAIELEKDRIVSAIYFTIIIIVVLYFLGITTVFEEQYPDFLKTEWCDAVCAKVITKTVLLVIGILIASITGWRGANLMKNALTVSTYLQSISSVVVPKTSIETLSRFIESGDWKTAEHWKRVVEEDYANEENLREKRINNLDTHISSIFSNFKKHKQKCEDNNKAELQKYINGDRSGETLSLIEILQTFSFYERLMEHLYTNEDKENFEQIHNVFQFNKDWGDSFQSTLTYKTTSIEKIISKLKIKKQKEIKSEILGENGQWINLELLSSHLDHYVSYTRIELIPIARKENSPLYQVRFFDRRGHENLGPDVIAEMYQEDANNLSNALDVLARELRQKNSGVQQIYQKVKNAEDQLKKSLKEIITAYDVNANPIKGSCKYCQNENFWNKAKISSDKKELEKIPQIVFLKQ